MSTNSTIVIGAIKELEKNNVTDEQIQYLGKKLFRTVKEELFRDGKATSHWIYNIIKSLNEVTCKT